MPQSSSHSPSGAGLRRMARALARAPITAATRGAASRAQRVVVRRIRWQSENLHQPWVTARVEVDAAVFDGVAFTRDEAGRPRVITPADGVAGSGPLARESVQAVLTRIADLILPPLRPLRSLGGGRYASDPRPRCTWEALMRAERASFQAMYTWEAARPVREPAPARTLHRGRADVRGHGAGGMTGAGHKRRG